MKSAIILSGLATILAAPLAAQNVAPLPPQGQATPTPAPTAQPDQTTQPPLPGQVAPKPYPATTTQSGQQNAQLPYEQTDTTAPPAYQQPATSYAAPAVPQAKAADFITVVDVISQSPTNTRLAQLLRQGGLVDALEATGPFTIFAPNDAAFMAMDQATLNDLLKPENKAALDRLLQYHVIKGYLASSELVKQLKKNGGKGSLPTLQGQTLVAALSPEGKVTLTDPEGHVATITNYDQGAFNGLIHTTDMVMVPKAPEDANGKKKKRRR
ncbi:fasciclin domain-containing protein [Novosphingopyxis iocasae]|uniref:fasciclin domain-containing protein n=1 Tax=Novosphingopyxis iocasae TaxID=2762729 RepID=UPI0016518E1E|nr:fasciclin domain-containing protein [Novosphingopyxis iocasae]